MRIYRSGPVTGLEDSTGWRFKEAEMELENKFSKEDAPLNIIDPFWANYWTFKRFEEIPTHSDYMTTSMAMLSLCDTIYMMRGWEQSEGCQKEYRYAAEHGYKIIYQAKGDNRDEITGRKAKP